MPYSNMDLQELAKMLGMDARQVERMAKQGQLPCRKIAGKYQVNRAELTEWLQQRIGSLGHDDLASMDAGITAKRQTLQDQPIIIPALHRQAIDVHLDARTKNSVLRELVALANETSLVFDAESILEALINREELCPTALDGGVAIPHPRRPLPYAIAEPIVAFARTGQGIGFGAPDGKLTDLFFLICAHDDHQHLHMLARLCRMLHDSTFMADLRIASSPDQILNLMTQREQAVLADSL
jgi:nitrogen PTS system EIIA component